MAIGAIKSHLIPMLFDRTSIVLEDMEKAILAYSQKYRAPPKFCSMRP
jgi:hypothetical protein